MLKMVVRVGDRVTVGETPDNGVCLKVQEKSGRLVGLLFASNLPIRNIGPGAMPQHFTTGITGIPRRVLEADLALHSQ